MTISLILQNNWCWNTQLFDTKNLSDHGGHLFYFRSAYECHRDTSARREIITVRGQSYVFRIPRLCCGGRTHSPGGEGGWGGGGVNILEDARHSLYSTYIESSLPQLKCLAFRNDTFVRNGPEKKPFSQLKSTV
jgi:hypothetical protein